MLEILCYALILTALIHRTKTWVIIGFICSLFVLYAWNVQGKQVKQVEYFDIKEEEVKTAHFKGGEFQNAYTLEMKQTCIKTTSESTQNIKLYSFSDIHRVISSTEKELVQMKYCKHLENYSRLRNR